MCEKIKLLDLILNGLKSRLKCHVFRNLYKVARFTTSVIGAIKILACFEPLEWSKTESIIGLMMLSYYSCFGDITQCVDGYSMALWMNIPQDYLHPTGVNYFISSGGQTRSVVNGGMAILAKQPGLSIIFKSRPDGKHWTISGITVNASTWFHLIISWNKYGHLITYINGLEVGRASGSGQSFTSPSTSSAMHLGKSNKVNSYHGKFSMDDCFFWSKTLSVDLVALVVNRY